MCRVAPVSARHRIIELTTAPDRPYGSRTQQPPVGNNVACSVNAGSDGQPKVVYESRHLIETRFLSQKA